METAIAITLLRMPAVEAATGLKKSKLHELIREGAFPAPVHLTRKSRAWRSDQVQEWILSRPSVSTSTTTEAI